MFDKLFISLDIHVINVRFLIGNMFICFRLFILLVNCTFIEVDLFFRQIGLFTVWEPNNALKCLSMI